MEDNKKMIIGQVVDVGVGITGVIGISCRILEEPGFLGSYGVHCGYSYFLTRKFGIKGAIASNLLNAAYEYAQHSGSLAGVGDLDDIISAVAGSVAAILVNKIGNKKDLK